VTSTNTAVQFETVAASLDGIPFTTRDQGWVLYDSFGEFRIQDEWWGWAKKTAAPHPTLRIEVTRSWTSNVIAAARSLNRNRARAAAP